MLHAPSQKSTSKPCKGKPAKRTLRRGPTKFPGIVKDAKALGVNRATLYRVLTGEWAQLRSLRARYESLKSKSA